MYWQVQTGKVISPCGLCMYMNTHAQNQVQAKVQVLHNVRVSMPKVTEWTYVHYSTHTHTYKPTVCITKFASSVSDSCQHSSVQCICYVSLSLSAASLVLYPALMQQNGCRRVESGSGKQHDIPWSWRLSKTGSQRTNQIVGILSCDQSLALCKICACFSAGS